MDIGDIRETTNPAFSELVTKLAKLEEELDDFPRRTDGQGMDDELDEFRRSNQDEITQLLNGMLPGLSIPNETWVSIKKKGNNLEIRYDGWEGEDEETIRKKRIGVPNTEYKITVRPDMSSEKKVIPIEGGSY